MQARKSAGEISTLDLKPMRKDTQSPKQEQSVAPQNGPWSKQKFKKKKKKDLPTYPRKPDEIENIWSVRAGDYNKSKVVWHVKIRIVWSFRHPFSYERTTEKEPVLYCLPSNNISLERM